MVNVGGTSTVASGTTIAQGARTTPDAVQFPGPDRRGAGPCDHFSQGHLTGPLCSDSLPRMGATGYDRSHHPVATFSTVAQAELFDIDAVVMPDKVVAGKGAGMDSLLKSDPSWLQRGGVRWWIGSSVPLRRRVAAAFVKASRRSSCSVRQSVGLFVPLRWEHRKMSISSGAVLVDVIDDA